MDPGSSLSPSPAERPLAEREGPGLPRCMGEPSRGCSCAPMCVLGLSPALEAVDLPSREHGP